MEKEREKINDGRGKKPDNFINGQNLGDIKHKPLV